MSVLVTVYTSVNFMILSNDQMHQSASAFALISIVLLFRVF